MTLTVSTTCTLLGETLILPLVPAGYSDVSLACVRSTLKDQAVREQLFMKPLLRVLRGFDSGHLVKVHHMSRLAFDRSLPRSLPFSPFSQ